MIRTKELLEHCSGDDTAVRIIRQVKLNRYCYFLFCVFFEFIMLAFFSLCGYITIFGMFGIPSAIILLFCFYTIPFCDEDGINYINIVLHENATIQNYKIQKIKYPYVYIFNDEDEFLQLTVSSIYDLKKIPYEYIRCRVYFQLRNNKIKKIYSPICCIKVDELVEE